jgi:hypothetical protein
MTVAVGTRKLGIGSVVALVGGVLALLGVILAWETVSAELIAGSGLSASTSGLEANGGKIIAVLAIVTLALAVLDILSMKVPVPFGVSVTILGVLATLVAVANYFSVTDDVNKANAIIAGLGSVGIGLYIAILGAVAMLAGGVLAIVMKKE